MTQIDAKPKTIVKLSTWTQVMVAVLLIAVCLNGVSGRAEEESDKESKPTALLTIKDGDKKIKITTAGISIKKNDQPEDLQIKEGIGQVNDGRDDDGANFSVRGKTHILAELEDIVVPIAFFVFLLAVILGGKYFSSRNEQKRLELLQLMVEKGQAVPTEVVNKILTPQAAPENDSSRQNYKRTRNAYGFTLAGILILAYTLFNRDWHNTGTLVPGLVFLSIGVGCLAGIYLPKRTEKISG